MKSLTQSFWILGTFGCLVFSGCAPQVDLTEIAPLKARVSARQASLSHLKTEGLCSENSSGMLTRAAGGALSVEQRTLIEEENFDRERIFEAVARAYSLSVSDVKTLFVEMQPAR